MAGGNPRRTEVAYGTLTEHIAELGDPVKFVHARAGITIRKFPAGMRPDLIDVALEAFVNGCLAWPGPDSGYPLAAYVTLRMRSGLNKAIPRLLRDRRMLGREHCLSDMEWLTYRPGHRDLDAAVDRWDLQRWADLAELTPYMRWAVEAFATHGSPRERPWIDGARAGIRHMRAAAITNTRREDHWTRARWDTTTVRARRRAGVDAGEL